MQQNNNSLASIGIGTDIESISRFRKLWRKKDKAFLSKIFTANELKNCFSKNDPAPHLAARFTGKEAVIKALSALGQPYPELKEIEITNDRKGMPVVKLKNKKLSGTKVKLSLAHCKNQAIAFALIIKM